MVPGETANCPGAAPVPVKLNDTVGFDALEVIASAPVTAPLACGVNVTLNVTACPGLSVAGGFTPLMLNPDPLGTIEDTVIALPPELVRVSESDWLDPVGTLPKLRLPGVALTVPGVTPVPDSGTFSVALEELLTIARFPVAAPADLGAKLTETVAV